MSIEQFAFQIGGLRRAIAKCPVMVGMLVATWFVFPFGVMSLLFPSDVVGFQDWMQGQPIRRFFTSQALVSGFVTALVVLALMCIVQLNLTTLIYRKVNRFATFWPLAIILIGLVANAVWYATTGYFDFVGAMVGFTPFLSAVLWQMVCEKLGGRFVFGPGYRENTFSRY
ncbi:MAG: hypothetical protein AB7F35_25430 [Acetobacteraceae bacterium]|uniref:hypothetical protein n=1 Tax=Bradyrhizobium sp. TaxID=376 RepID=UPI003D13877E